jgi:hypothetical protein
MVVVVLPTQQILQGYLAIVDEAQPSTMPAYCTDSCCSEAYQSAFSIYISSLYKQLWLMCSCL